MSFKIGDVVQLKSGGALMTISDITNEDAFCVWNDGKRSYSELYKVALLQKPTDPLAGLVG